MPAYSHSDDELGVLEALPDRSNTGSSTSRAIIHVSALCKEYPEYRLAVDDLQIPSGVVALLGHSGSGKSTFLRILAGLDPKYSGEVRFPFEDHLSGIQRSRNCFSYAFQSANLLSNLSVKANVKMGCSLAGFEVQDQDVASALAPFFPEFNGGRIDGLLSRYPSDLSVGQRQRVAVARAYLKARSGSSVLFADEPTANLDPHSAHLCFGQLCRWQREDPSRLLILATHDLSLAHKADHIIFLGQQDRLHGVNTFGVNVSDTTSTCWERVHHLLEGNSNLAEESIEPSGAEPFRPGKGTRKPARQFFFQYFLRDILRGRDLLGTVCRLTVVFMLFLVMSVCSVLLHGAPRFAKSILESDRFLRLVRIESTGGFPIAAKKMNLLNSINELNGALRTKPNEKGRRVLSGISPMREFPLRLYRQDGLIHDRWIDSIQTVYPEHPELESEDVLFDFWGISELRRDSGLVVTPALLELLGYKPKEVLTDIERDAAYLYADREGWRFRLPIAAIHEFPDDNVGALIPALLANQYLNGTPEGIEERFRTVLLGGFTDESEAHYRLQAVKTGLKSVLKLIAPDSRLEDSLELEAKRWSFDQGDSFAISVTTENARGFSEEQMMEAAEAIRELLPTDCPVEGIRRILPGNSVETELSAATNQAMLFVRDFNDVPPVIDFLEHNRPELKLKVMNSNNREFIRTSQLAVSALRKGVTVFAAMFGIACFFGILTSFSSMLRRKVSEIAVLKVFGSGGAFILCRFLLEAILICGVSAGLAIWLSADYLIPYIDSVLRVFSESRSTFAAPKLTFEAENFRDLMVVLIVACVALGCVVAPYVRKDPSRLLSLSE